MARRRQRKQAEAAMQATGNQLSGRQSESLRKGLLGTANDPFRAGQALAQFGGFYEGGLGRINATTSPEMQGILNQYQALSQQYADGGRSGDIQSYLDQMKAGLGGYTSQQSQGFREQAQRGIDRQYQTGIGQQAIAQARGGVRGASAAAQMANLNRARMGEQQNLEQDLFVRNADEQQRRLQAYGESVRGVEADEFGRRTQSLAAYGQSQAGQEAVNTANQQFNLSQLGQERAGALSSVLTMAELGQGNRRYKEQMDLYRQAIQRGRPYPVF
jgi:hypothetical protein